MLRISRKYRRELKRNKIKFLYYHDPFQYFGQDLLIIEITEKS